MTSRLDVKRRSTDRLAFVTLLVSGMDVEFKVPQTIPQDLLLIQDIVATTHPVAHHPPSADECPSDDDSIASSANGSDSEVEVAANLMPCGEENVQQP